VIVMRRLLAIALLALGLGFAAPAGATTWNPSDKDASMTLSALLGNSNLIATQNGASGSWRSVRSTGSGKHTGKYYFEATVVKYDGGNGIIVGVSDAAASTAIYAGGSTGSVGFQITANEWPGGAGNGCSGWNVVGKTVAIAVDLTANKAWCTIDGSAWHGASGSNDPVTGTGGLDISSANDGASVMIMFSGQDVGGNPDAVALNTGVGSGFFRFAIPSGFSGWDGAGSAAGTNTVTAATFDPSDNSTLTLSNGNRTAAGATASTWKTVLATDVKYTGKLYFEMTVDTEDVSNSGWIGAVVSQWWGVPLLNKVGDVTAGGTLDAISFDANTALAAGFQPAQSSTPNGTVIGVAVDVDNHRMWVTKNGTTWFGSGGTPNPAMNTNGFSLVGLDMLGVMIAFSAFDAAGGDQATLNVQGPFSHTVPSGFTGWDAAVAGGGGLLLRGVGG
jgi:hypothetical protein